MIEDFTNLKNDVQEYIEVRFDLIKLHLAENLSRLISNGATVAIIGFFLFFIFFFLSFAAGYYFANILKSNELGFLLVAGFYFLLLLVFLVFRKRIIERPIIKAIVKLFFAKIKSDES
ncbi:MAG: phage holin family protein [Salinivirgaceae bacterium]